MSTERNDSPVHHLLDSAFNQGSFAVVDELLGPSGLAHTPSWGMPDTREGFKQLIALLRSAFSDLHCTVEGEIREGDRVVAYWTIRGTHTGLFLGNPPTSRQITVQGMLFARTVHGQITEGWALLDQMGMLEQLGIVPRLRSR